MEHLVTPEMSKSDVVFPGENWFFYWKTSPSLWEAKLREFNGPNPLFVPIYWALHSEYVDSYDFGETKPETDLAKLNQAAVNAGKEIIFLVQLSPMPFTINGAIPSYLARTLSINKDGLAISVIDAQDRINRIYSFFEPKVYQAYRKFMGQLGQYFRRSGLTNSVYGLDVYRIEDDHFISFFKDHSAVFDTGFKRYITQLAESEPEKLTRLKEDVEYEKELKNEYQEVIKKLYFDASKEAFNDSWRGDLKVCLLGANTKDLFRRSQEKWESEQDYFTPLFKSVCNHYIPSSIVLNSQIKKNSLDKALKDVVSSSLIQSHLNKDFFEDDFSLSLQPLFFFELCDGESGHFSFEQAMMKSGLKYFIGKHFPWSYKISKEQEFDFDDINEQCIYFYFGSRLDLKKLNNVLRLFMNGVRVFIDTSDFDKKLENRLDSFFVENNIKVERINYISPVLKASLGEGCIITYDSDTLKKTSLIKRTGFWQKMMNFLDIKHLQVESDEGVEYFWKVRGSNTYELSYEEIRRVSFYNPTSYKLRAKVVTANGFAFIKSVDQVNAEVKSTPVGIEVQMQPGGSVSLDFGYFEVS